MPRLAKRHVLTAGLRDRRPQARPIADAKANLKDWSAAGPEVEQQQHVHWPRSGILAVAMHGEVTACQFCASTCAITRRTRTDRDGVSAFADPAVRLVTGKGASQHPACRCDGALPGELSRGEHISQRTHVAAHLRSSAHAQVHNIGRYTSTSAPQSPSLLQSTRDRSRWPAYQCVATQMGQSCRFRAAPAQTRSSKRTSSKWRKPATCIAISSGVCSCPCVGKCMQ